VRIRFIGEIPSAVRDQLAQHGLLSRTEATGYVSHDAALELLGASSILVGAGPRDGRKSLRGLIPAKLLEYLSPDLPIVYISRTPNDGADLLEQHVGAQVVGVGEAEAIQKALLQSLGTKHERDVEALGWRARAAELAAVLDESSRTSV